MRTDLAISACLHAALLLWFALTFSIAPKSAPSESLPVDIVSDKQFSELMKGVRNAPKAETPKPLVDKVEEPKPVQTPEPVPTVSQKPEIKPIPKETPPEQKPPEQKPAEAKQEQKPPEPKDAKQEQKTPPKPDPIAEALKKEEARKAAEAKAAEKARAKAEAAARKQSQFNPDKIAEMLDKRNPQRQALGGQTPNKDPTLGIAAGTAPALSIDEISALRERLMRLWNPPAGASNPEEMVVKIRVKLGRDGKLAGPPMVLTSGRGSLFEAARDRAVRALFEGQPFEMLKPEHYDLWKEIEITFDPREMTPG